MKLDGVPFIGELYRGNYSLGHVIFVTITLEKIVFRPCFEYQFSSASNFLSNVPNLAIFGHFNFFFRPYDVIPDRKLPGIPEVNKKTPGLK